MKKREDNRDETDEINARFQGLYVCRNHVGTKLNLYAQC